LAARQLLEFRGQFAAEALRVFRVLEDQGALQVFRLWRPLVRRKWPRR
jgi:hypothetical protein